jgi:hypothetical protein
MKEGFGTRFERVLIMGIGLIAADLIDLDVLTAVLWILAILASFTALQRLIMVWLKTREEPPRK